MQAPTNKLCCFAAMMTVELPVLSGSPRTAAAAARGRRLFDRTATRMLNYSGPLADPGIPALLNSVQEALKQATAERVAGAGGIPHSVSIVNHHMTTYLLVVADGLLVTPAVAAA